MHEYRQLPLEGFGQITTLKETLLPYTREFENDDESYTLTPENFLDALENRIQFVDFYVTSLHTARIFALPKCRDHLGRVKVDLAINPDGSLERQAKSLIHEMIHVDRNSWEKVQGLNSFADEFYQIKAEEERLVATAARTFYDAHPSLSALALCHVWQRYTQEVDRFSGDSNI